MIIVIVNPTQVHVKTLFSFMPYPETETTPFQSHSNTDDYLAAPHVYMDINPSNYYKENIIEVSISCEACQSSWSTFFIFTSGEAIQQYGKIFHTRKTLTER